MRGIDLNQALDLTYKVTLISKDVCLGVKC
jgi:hypothetical protein